MKIDGDENSNKYSNRFSAKGIVLSMFQTFVANVIVVQQILS
jgi:hypothetical protein